MIDEKQNPTQQSGQQPQQENKPTSGQQQDRKPSQGSPQPDIPREPRNADSKGGTARSVSKPQSIISAFRTYSCQDGA